MAPPANQGTISMTAAPPAKPSAGASERWCFGGFATGMMCLMVLVEAWPETVRFCGIPAGWSTTARAVAATAALALAIKSIVRFMRSQH